MFHRVPSKKIPSHSIQLKFQFKYQNLHYTSCILNCISNISPCSLHKPLPHMKIQMLENYLSCLSDVQNLHLLPKVTKLWQVVENYYYHYIDGAIHHIYTTTIHIYDVQCYHWKRQNVTYNNFFSWFTAWHQM